MRSDSTPIAAPGCDGPGPAIRRARLQGIGVSAGLIVGPAYIVADGSVTVPEYRIAADAVDAEIGRLEAALAQARSQLDRLRLKLTGLPERNHVQDEVVALLDAHAAMIGSGRLRRGIAERIRTHLVNAEAAVEQEIDVLVASFRAMDDAYISARLEDVREVGQRILKALMQRGYDPLSSLPAGAVLIAETLSPADMALIDPARVAGIATALGGPQGHMAIMARSLGLPAVVGVSGLLALLDPGDCLALDGESGEIVVEPDGDELASVYRRRQAREAAHASLQDVRLLPAVTLDGIAVEIHANIEFPREAERAFSMGAEGIGLLRTEFMFMNRADVPGEEEQYSALRQIMEAAQGRPVTARTLDIGGEKLAESLSRRLPPGPNPALGLRGIRLSLREVSLLRTQLSAMLRASVLGDLRILVPMIVNAEELVRVRAVMGEEAARLRAGGLALPPELPPLGAMIEVPAAALTADSLAGHADFLAIGTNDLTQYTLAVDRADEQVAEMFDPAHPAVLRLIQFTLTAADRMGIPVCICGEVAGDHSLTSLLLGLGARSLSMSTGNLLRVKGRVRALTLPAALAEASSAMAGADRTSLRRQVPL